MRDNTAEHRERLRRGAEDFARKCASLPTVLEVVLCGSLCMDDPYPLDIDVAVVLSGLDDLPAVARFARQMSRFYHAWEVFLFDPTPSFIGFVCHRKACPEPYRCDSRACGRVPYLFEPYGFRFSPARFLEPEIEPLWVREGESRLAAWRKRLEITGRPRLELEPLRLKCIECGRPFTFSVAEQKIFLDRGLSTPKRCERCRERRWLQQYGIDAESEEWDERFGGDMEEADEEA